LVGSSTTSIEDAIKQCPGRSQQEHQALGVVWGDGDPWSYQGRQRSPTTRSRSKVGFRNCQ